MPSWSEYQVDLKRRRLEDQLVKVNSGLQQVTVVGRRTTTTKPTTSASSQWSLFSLPTMIKRIQERSGDSSLPIGPPETNSRYTGKSDTDIIRRQSNGDPKATMTRSASPSCELAACVLPSSPVPTSKVRGKIAIPSLGQGSDTEGRLPVCYSSFLAQRLSSLTQEHRLPIRPHRSSPPIRRRKSAQYAGQPVRSCKYRPILHVQQRRLSVSLA